MTVNLPSMLGCPLLGAEVKYISPTGFEAKLNFF